MSRLVLLAALSLSSIPALAAGESVVWTADMTAAALKPASELGGNWYTARTWYHWGAVAVKPAAAGAITITGGSLDASLGNTLGTTCASAHSDVWLRYTVTDVAVNAAAQGYRGFNGPRIVSGDSDSTPMLGGSPGSLEPGLYLINVAQTYATFPSGEPLLRLDCIGMQIGMKDLQLVRDPALSFALKAADAAVAITVVVDHPALEVSVRAFDADHQGLPLAGKGELALKSADKLIWTATAELPTSKDGKPWKPSALTFKAQPIPVKGGAPFPTLFTANSIALGK